MQNNQQELNPTLLGFVSDTPLLGNFVSDTPLLGNFVSDMPPLDDFDWGVENNDSYISLTHQTLQQLEEEQPFKFGSTTFDTISSITNRIKNKEYRDRFFSSEEYTYLISCFEKFKLLNYNHMQDVFYFSLNHECDSIILPPLMRKDNPKYINISLQYIIVQIINKCRNNKHYSGLDRLGVAMCTIAKCLIHIHNLKMLQLTEKFQFLNFCITIISSVRYFIEPLASSNIGKETDACMICYEQVNTNFVCGHKICRLCSKKYIDKFTYCCICKKTINQFYITAGRLFDISYQDAFTCGVLWLKHNQKN